MTALTISALDLSAIRAHAELTYPEEGCGLLIGASAPAKVRRVLRIEPTANRATEERGRRYVIPPDVLRDAETRLQTMGESVIGIFHSHPDHPAVPSSFDREHALPWYAYVLVSVDHGKSRDLGAFELDPEERTFRPIPVAVLPGSRSLDPSLGGTANR